MITPLHPDHSFLQQILMQLKDTAPTETGYPGTVMEIGGLAHNAMQQGYIQAIIDMLELIGMVKINHTFQTVRISSVQAGYACQLLLALSMLEMPLITDWDTRGIAEKYSKIWRGVDFLTSLEQLRLALQPDAVPLRETHAAIGFIARKAANHGTEYLMLWDADAHMWQFIGGKQEWDDSSMHRTMLRELNEELQIALREYHDVIITALGAPFFEVRLSPTYGILTRTLFQVYSVQFITTLPTLPPQGRWIDESEIRAGFTHDQQPISSIPFHRLMSQPTSVQTDIWIHD